MMEDLSEKQKLILEQFKENVSNTTKPATFDEDDNLYFRRWLIARNFDLAKSESMLRKSLAYRKTQQTDTILDTYKAPEVLEKYYVGGVCGFDKGGCPIWLDPFTKLDSKGILHSVTKPQVIRHKLHTCETLLTLLQAQSKKLGRPVNQVVIIFDMADLGWKHLWKPGIDTFREIVAQFEDNYPELLKKTYIINAPKLFVIGYNMIKPVISPRTAGKVHILGKHWFDVLRKEIDPDQLPKCYGGTQVDENGDERCLSKVLYGGDVPESFFFTNEEIDAELESVTVANGACHMMNFDITVPNCKLSYNVKSNKHDIAFGILYKPLKSEITQQSEMDVIIPVQRLNTHLVTQSGVIECDKAGVYVVILDNTFSWTKSKKVLFSVDVLCAEDGESFSSALEVTNDDEPVTDFA